MRQVARLVAEELDLTDLERTYAGRGSRPHRPDLLLALLLYEHAEGRPQPVQWHKDLDDRKSVQWLVFGMKPSLTALYEFRDRVQPLLENFNQQVLRTAIDEGHTDASCAALDGTTVAANATRHRLLTLETVEQRLNDLARADDAVESTPETVMMPTDTTATCPPQPPEVVVAPEAAATVPPSPETTATAAPSPTPPPAWMARTPRGRQRQRRDYRRAQAELRAKHRANRCRRKDKRKKDKQIRLAIGDPTAPFGLDKAKTFRPLYTVQTICDVTTDLVFAYATTATTTDSGQLVPMIDRATAATGKPLKDVFVDSGYPSGPELAQCTARGVTVYGPWNANAFTETKRAKKGTTKETIPKDQFTFDSTKQAYRCPEGKELPYRRRTSKQKADGTYVPLEIYRADPADCASCPRKGACVESRSGARTVRRQEQEEHIEALKGRMQTAEAKTKYKQRGCTIERRFADLKTHQGLQRFSGRTRERADAQLGLTVLAHNLRVLAKLRAKSEQREQMPQKTAA